MFLGSHFFIEDLVKGGRSHKKIPNLHIKNTIMKGGEEMDTLNKIVRKYLDENGISDKFFEKYIGCSQSVCSKWFKGERKLTEEHLQKTHEFLSGKHVKTVADIMKEE